MKEIENLYFIAIIPQEELCNEIIRFKKDFAERFASKEALKVVPHITLKTPFRLPVSEHTKLLEWIRKLYINYEPFKIELKDFGAFHNPLTPVIFVHPVMNTALYSLQKEIARSFKISYPELISRYDLKFMPHITVAYRDLEQHKFEEAWNEYKQKKFSAQFEVDKFYLLQHDTKRWNIIDTYLLKN